MYKNFSLENIWVRTFDFGLALGFGKKDFFNKNF